MLNRRCFLRSAGVAGTGLLILPRAQTAFGYRANERLNLAIVGMAGFGAYHGFAQAIHTYRNARYAFGCDVDRRKVQKVYDFWKQRAVEWAASAKEDERKAAAEHYQPLAEKPPPLIADFREMLDKEGKSIDAVIVATPDHSHAVIAAAALRAGKPVLAEKPLTISAHEARALHRLAKSTGLPTQMNNHGASSPGFRRGLEVIRDGLLGDIAQVHVFFSRGGAGFQKSPQGAEPVPPELHWDLWLAQLQWREYHPDWINRIGWRDTCIGQLGNFGPHSANLAFMGLNVRELWDGGSAPIRITAEADEANQLSFPRWERIRWEVPARGILPPVTFTWTHGHRPDYAPGSRKMLGQILLDHGAAEADLEKLLPDAGCLILGSKGLLATTSHNTEIRLLPAAKFADVEQRKPLHTPASTGHYKEWVEACQGGGVTPISNFDYAAPFAEFLAAGSIATRFPGEPIDFVPVKGEIANHPKAAAHLAYAYRAGWTI